MSDKEKEKSVKQEENVTSEDKTPKNGASDNIPKDDDIDKDTLIQILKEKSREIKTTSTKLQKLEGKYVLLFKESKKHIGDRDNLMKFLATVFGSENNEQLEQATKAKLGEVDYNKLQQLFFQREANKEEAMNKIMQDYHEEKRIMELKFKQKLQEYTSSADQESKTTCNELEKQVEELQSNNSKLTKEIIELNQVLEQKNNQILSLEKQDDMIKKIQTENLLSELQLNHKKASDSLDVKGKIMQAELQNQIITLKSELEKANEKIHQLETITPPKIVQPKSPQLLSFQQSSQIQQQAKKKVAVSNSETQTDSILDQQTGQFIDRVQYNNEQFNRAYGLNVSQSNPLTPGPQTVQPQVFANSISPEGKVYSQTPKTIHMQQKGNNHKLSQFNYESSMDFNGESEEMTSEQRFKLNEEYLKNVILKYFEYSESRQYKEAALLQSSIMTILRMTPDDRQKIQLARDKGSLWNTTLSYIPFINKNNNQQGGNGMYTNEVLQTQ